MVSDSGVVTASQIDYKQDMFSHPEYKFEPQFPNTFGQTIALGTSQTPVTINVPPVVFNYSPSILSYTVTLPEVNGSYIWYAAQMFSEISHIQAYGTSGQWIVDVDNLQNYADITVKKELSFDEFASLDIDLCGTGVSDALENSINALRNSNMTAVNFNAGAAYNASKNYVEPSYFKRGAQGNGAGAGNVVYNVQIPLKFIKKYSLQY